MDYAENQHNDSLLKYISRQCRLQKALAFDEPYEFKGITFYPVKLQYLFEFYICVSVLMIKQERSKDRKLIKMPYLWFLFYAWDNWTKYDNPEYGFYIYSLFALLELVTGKTDFDFQYQYDNKGSLKKCSLIIDGIELNYKDFEEIRNLILEQAGIEWTNEFIHKDAEQAIKDGQEFENKKNGYISPSLEDLVDITSMYLHISNHELKSSFTIRKFNNMIKHMSRFEDYKLIKSAELSGMVTVKNPVQYWVSGIEKTDLLKNENINYRNSDFMKM